MSTVNPVGVGAGPHAGMELEPLIRTEGGHVGTFEAGKMGTTRSSWLTKSHGKWGSCDVNINCHLVSKKQYLGLTIKVKGSLDVLCGRC